MSSHHAAHSREGQPVRRRGEPGACQGRPFGVGVGAGVVLLALMAACATNPVSGKRELSLISEAEEIAIGQQADADVRREMGVYDNPELQRYVSDIGTTARAGSRIVRNLPWTFTVVDHPAVNAFALPGGFIYITRGILPYLDDEAELAGVLGHEIGHVTARHAAQQYTRAALGQASASRCSGIFVPATQPFGDLSSAGARRRVPEVRARRRARVGSASGSSTSREGGWDPERRAALPRRRSSRMDELSERGVPNWLSTHPEPAERVDRGAADRGEAGGAERRRAQSRRVPRADRRRRRRRQSEGRHRSRQRLSPSRCCASRVEFPEGWDVINTPSQVAAREPGAAAFHDAAASSIGRAGSTIEEIARAIDDEPRGFKRVDGRDDVSWAGSTRTSASIRARSAASGTVMMRAAHIAQGRQVYLLAGFAPRDALRRDRSATSTRRSARFAALTAREADEHPPESARLLHVRPGDTWQSIAVARRRARPCHGARDHERPRRQRTADAGRAHQDRRRGLRSRRRTPSIAYYLRHAQTAAQRRCAGLVSSRARVRYLAYVYLTLPDVRALATTNPHDDRVHRAAQARSGGSRAASSPIRQRWVPYTQISNNLRRAVLVAEDSAFFDHDGIDLKELRASLEAELGRGPLHARREHDHAAAGEEPLPVAVAQSDAQAEGAAASRAGSRRR